MPYIKPDEREPLDEIVAALTTELRNGNFRGRLNYTISSVLAGLLEANGTSYSFLNDFIGVLECVKLEAYRRVAAPYEDGKILENGDVFVTDAPIECRKPLAHNPQFEGKHHCQACERELKSE